MTEKKGKKEQEYIWTTHTHTHTYTHCLTHTQTHTRAVSQTHTSSVTYTHTHAVNIYLSVFIPKHVHTPRYCYQTTPKLKGDNQSATLPVTGASIATEGIPSSLQPALQWSRSAQEQGTWCIQTLHRTFANWT